MYQHLPCFISVLGLLFFLAVLSNRIDKISAFEFDGYTRVDIVNRTCKICSEKSRSFNYGFCQSSIQVIPTSHATNLQGIGIIAMELALENATTTVSSIKGLLGGEGFSPFSLACLEKCLMLYSDALVELVDGAATFLTGHYGEAILKIKSAMQAPTACEDAFSQKRGVKSPLTNQNFNMFHLGEIALCIINWLTLLSA